MCVSHAPLHRICSEWHENKNSSCMLSFISYSIVSEDKCVLGFNLKSLKFTSDANAIFYILHTCPLMWCFLPFGSNIFFSCKSVWVDGCGGVWLNAWRKPSRWANLICGCDNVGKRHARFMARLYLWLVVSHLDSLGICISAHTHTHSKTERCPNSFLPPILAKLKPPSFPVRFYYP